MARPRKEGLEYFPLDIDIDQDDKLVVPIAKYGNRGFGVIVRLMMEVYRNGYYYNWTEKEQYVFAMKVNEDINYVQEVVSECINWGFFDRNMAETHHILTSHGIQKRFLMAANRRVGVLIKDEYALVTIDKKVSATETRVSADNNPSKSGNMSAESTQSKVKESKEKEIYKDHVCDDSEKPNLDTYPDAFNQFWEVFPPYRKRDKAKAFKAWQKATKKIDQEKLIQCTKLYAVDFKTIGRNGEFAKMPTTYLNAETYKDYLGGEKDGPGTTQPFGGRQAHAQTGNAGYQEERYGRAAAISSSRDVGRSGEGMSDNDIFVRR
ncbi:DUF4373 domain-containing protein [Paenibacillus thiaminolyticus]|uniref:DUF4373 domain-containing protein n=1 Tax=Paenibacillus thiaminolyticus TaxID=49283 RepID=UPI0011655EF9|nr:DUF4373 domain-containing protein [Paenibacillus thiaminolyticus]NGP60091.1 DUF4373 domain-containing protein [Paenibacillus thiaminolyticus]NGP60127.1 DUF4373 domain-containing protein [Paenibacillus thiaminolyticus]